MCFAHDEAKASRSRLCLLSFPPALLLRHTLTLRRACCPSARHRHQHHCGRHSLFLALSLPLFLHAVAVRAARSLKADVSRKELNTSVKLYTFTYTLTQDNPRRCLDRCSCAIRLMRFFFFFYLVLFSPLLVVLFLRFLCTVFVSVLFLRRGLV